MSQGLKTDASALKRVGREMLFARLRTLRTEKEGTVVKKPRFFAAKIKIRDDQDAKSVLRCRRQETDPKRNVICRC